MYHKGNNETWLNFSFSLMQQTCKQACKIYSKTVARSFKRLFLPLCPVRPHTRFHIRTPALMARTKLFKLLHRHLPLYMHQHRTMLMQARMKIKPNRWILYHNCLSMHVYSHSRVRQAAHLCTERIPLYIIIPLKFFVVCFASVSGLFLVRIYTMHEEALCNIAPRNCK